jgi:hypothetical protein
VPADPTVAPEVPVVAEAAGSPVPETPPALVPEVPAPEGSLVPVPVGQPVPDPEPARLPPRPVPWPGEPWCVFVVAVEVVAHELDPPDPVDVLGVEEWTVAAATCAVVSGVASKPGQPPPATPPLPVAPPEPVPVSVPTNAVVPALPDVLPPTTLAPAPGVDDPTDACVTWPTELATLSLVAVWSLVAVCAPVEPVDAVLAFVVGELGPAATASGMDPALAPVFGAG